MTNEARIFSEMMALQQGYASTYRAIITKERYESLIESKLIKKFTMDSQFLREPLIEHTGHLPIIAAYLYSQLNNPNIDLGRAMIMLSVHDIGEITTGDIFAYKKNKGHQEKEYQAVKSLLPECLFKYFEEFEELKTPHAKFAKAVDALAPELHELALPKVTIQRFKHHSFSTDMILAKKEKYFQFDPILKKLFAYVIEQYRLMEKGQLKDL